MNRDNSRLSYYDINSEMTSSQQQRQSGPFISTAQDISALVGCIKKLMALYEVQLCQNNQIQPLNLAQVAPEKSSRDQS